MTATLKLWIAIAVVILGLAGAVWIGSERLSAARSELARTQGQVDTLSSSLDALQARAALVERSINNLNQRSAENERRIGNVLRQEKEWADSPVPPVVADELCKFATCSTRDPAGQM